jgi:predicted ArsR family transcriptional regulator
MDAGLHHRRAEVLGLLRVAGVPLSVADVAGRLGVHVNTARLHLDALVGDGTVVKTLEPPSGPGRPRTVYGPHPGMDRGGTRHYRLLAQILLSQLAADEPDAGAAAVRAGREWGRFLADPPPPFQRLSAAEATTRLTDLLDRLGFAPEASGGNAVPAMVRLRHCPFLELAEGYDQLVCRVHLGLMQGALTELGGPVAATGLEPFAEPAACIARLEHADAA